MRPDRQEHYLGPTFAYHMAGGWMVHGQLAMGLTPESDNLVRLNAGYEF